MAFSAGDTYTIKEVMQHAGEWYAKSTRWDTLWFPLSSTDWKGGPGAQGCGCCVVTKANFQSQKKVVRGPAWEVRLSSLSFS